MDPNNYFSTILPQQFHPILQAQQIPIEHLISAQQQYNFNNNNIFAATMPTLTPIATPTAATCYIQNATAAAVGGSSPPFSLYTTTSNNNNSFGGNSLSLSNNTSCSSTTFPSQQPFQHSSLQQQQQQQLLEQSSFVQISLSPSIPQPISVIIDGQQYLEFPSSTPGEQSQFIPLQLFLQPQNYIPQQSSAEIVYPSAAIPVVADSNLLIPPILTHQSMSLQSPPLSQQSQFVKMDTTPTPAPAAETATISPPTKTRRTKSPQKKSTNENKFDRIPQTQSSIYAFLSPQSQSTPSSTSKMNKSQQQSDDDDIQIVGDSIKTKYIQSEYSDVQIIETKPHVLKNSEPIAPKASTQKPRKKATNAANKSTVDSTPIITPSNTQTSSDSIHAFTQPSASSAAPSNKRTSSAAALRRSTSAASSNNTPIKATSTASTSSATSTSSNAVPSTSSASSVPATSTTSGTVPPTSARRNISSTTYEASSTSTTPVAGEEQTDESSSEPLDPLEERLQYRSSLNSRVSPTFDYKMTTEIIKEIVPIILKVIPNAIINGIGPAYHECGSFINLAFDEETREIAFVWFFFSLSIMIGDKQKKELQTPDAETLQTYIKEIERKFEEANITQHSVIRMQRGAYKLIFDHKRINAKVTLLFCAQDACKRSQIIRLYTRFHTKMIQVAYLYSNMIMSNSDLYLLTNTPLCYMIIYFLQQTDRIEVIHQSPAKSLIDNINLFQPPDYRTEDIIHLLKQNKKHVNDSVAILAYEFAKFYSTFDYDKIIIDIAQKERRYWSKADAENKKPIAVRCCFSGKNLAGQISSLCLSTFQKQMKDVVDAFKAGNEATVFTSDLEEFAKKSDSKSHR